MAVNIRSEDAPVAREMTLLETDVVIDYFHGATPEFLNSLGVDPARLPSSKIWRARYEDEYRQPLDKRKTLLVLWEAGGVPIGFSTADKIVVGQEAYMHLHIVRPDKRRAGTGTALVRATAAIYFEKLKLQRLFCEPYAFNAAPNRTLQKAGFKYVMTHETIPGPLNFHQPVNRWVLER